MGPIEEAEEVATPRESPNVGVSDDLRQWLHEPDGRPVGKLGLELDRRARDRGPGGDHDQHLDGRGVVARVRPQRDVLRKEREVPGRGAPHEMERLGGVASVVDREVERRLPTVPQGDARGPAQGQ